MSAEDRITELGIQLPPAPKPAGVYKPVLVLDGMAYVSGHGPVQSDGSLITGRVGADLDLEAGKAAARQTGLAILASLRSCLGSLDRVQRVIKLLGMVNSPVILSNTRPSSMAVASYWARSLATSMELALAVPLAWDRCQ